MSLYLSDTCKLEDIQLPKLIYYISYMQYNTLTCTLQHNTLIRTLQYNTLIRTLQHTLHILQCMQYYLRKILLIVTITESINQEIFPYHCEILYIFLIMLYHKKWLYYC